MKHTLKFLKRRQWYNKNKTGFSQRDNWQNGLPVVISGVRFPDARAVMQELVHWYWYNGNDKVIIQGMPTEKHNRLLHLGAFFHPSGQYSNVVTAGAPAELVELIDAISMHLDGKVYSGSTLISDSGTRTFEGR